jgi:hypothetical protein
LHGSAKDPIPVPAEDRAVLYFDEAYRDGSNRKESIEM